MAERKGIPPAWEPYLTGQVAAEPTGNSWVREQLTLYGILPPETPHRPHGRRNRARKTHAIKGFFQFLHEGEALPKHPFATIPSPRVEKRERRVLSEAAYQALGEPARQRSPRDVVVVELLLQTGQRASELCGLRLGDIHFGEPGQPGLLLVRQGKGKKDRVVPLNSVAEQAVRASLETREDRSPTAPLLVQQGGSTSLDRGIDQRLASGRRSHRASLCR
jgi:site-specific recombinase XerD